MLSIDIETYSSVDITKSGVYAYTEAEDFEILLFAYAYEDKEINIIDLAFGEKLPQGIIEDLTNPKLIKTAFNANFERTCLAKYLNKPMPPEQWRCSAVHALALGFGGSLEGAAKSLNLQQQKMKEGKALIRYFSMPCKRGERSRNLPQHNIEKWKVFKTYCKQDVEVERAVRKKLEKYPVTKKEWELWALDQKINDSGVKIDKVLVHSAIECDKTCQSKKTEEAAALTGLENPNSQVQLKGWLETKGVKAESLSKEKVRELLKEVEDEKVKRVLKLRQELSKTSVKKYEAIKRAVCKDERVRGLLKFYGANRTGRWSGKLVQTQNLPRNTMDNLEAARMLLKSGNYEMLEVLFYSVPEVLSQLIRTAFIPAFNSRFIVSDFSAIEARVIAWLAGEKWVIDTFKGSGKVYEMAASRMFGVPIEKIVKGNMEYSLRQKGKVATLACGYQGSTGALIAMGAVKMGLKEEELSGIVAAWRKSNSNIVKLWRKIEDAAIKAVREKKVVKMQYGLEFFGSEEFLFIKLPSGRSLSYVRPRIEKDFRFNKLKLTYEGIEQGTKAWGRLNTYGGKLTENIVQAIARDCLAYAMLRLDRAGYKIVFHVHDEVILDVPNGFGSLKEVNEIMGKPIEWAKGLPLKADGFETDYYKKD
ncbi:XRE family transcriptional regulator [Clostridium carboxidivorans P7]|uniref:DNA-directed DNA polymerase n=1 Tax=Clostridium carboxidivorans P7 TaxID=536227 RepID=C6PV63_9CLOT|nr:DNA polymerase [Clostridium carboxidivorans]AKN33789.1 XRE family transcriptional regulator [Clostridium carboxidivorans P7]EET86881.1 DNA-directed DNA polymerase [Clostridium carboxidivorans P7]EFG86602.1 DNA-directed DNA polymerase [Clostridium carboxidivorans P7]